MNLTADTECRYEAFLSYAHADERPAAWLHRALEQFRIPRKLDPDRRRFRPFFRDQDELASSADLSRTLLEALRDSASLVVLCSPAAASSRWVEEEVRVYKELGRGHRIFCILTAGDPNDPESVFPPALRDDPVPLAIDLRNFRRDRKTALLRLAAALLDVSYDALRRRHQQRLRQRLARSAAGTVAAAIFVAAVTYEMATAPPCTGSAARFAEVWNDGERTAIASRFASSGLPYATDSWNRVDSRLATYAGEWVEAHTEACAATLVREEQSQQLMDLRMACLEDRRFAFATLVASLREADGSVLEQAIDAAAALPGLARCSDPEQLEVRFPLPDDPAARDRVTAARSAAIEARTLLSTGRIEEALARLDQADGMAIDYPPLEAEILIVRGNAEARSGAAETARSTLYDATSKAVLSRDNELIARTWLALAQLMVDFRDRIDEAFDVLQVTQSYMTRLPEDDPLQASFHHLRGTALSRASRLDEALEDLTRAVELGRAVDSPELPDFILARTLALVSNHQVEQARQLSAEALALTRTTLGEDHPKYADALIKAARAETWLGNTAQALAYLEDAVRIMRAAYPENSPSVVYALDQLGWALKDNGRFEEGIAVLEQALAMESGFEAPRLRIIASLYNGLGDTYISLGDFDSAATHMQQALSAWMELGPGTAIGVGLNNLGNLANRKGDHRAAEDYCRRSYENDLAFYEEDHPSLAYALTCLGEALLGQERAADALEPLARAEALRDRPDIGSAALAWTRWLYGRALAESRQDVQRGIDYVQASRGVFADLGGAGSSELHDIDAWLAEQ